MSSSAENTVSSRHLRWSSGSPDALEAFDALYRMTYRRTLAYALRRTTGRADAQDVVADTYLVAWRRREEFVHTHEPQAWLYGVAFRQLSNQRRTQSRHMALLEKANSHELNVQIEPSLTVEAYEEVIAVERGMSTLSERDQEILRLAGYEELDHREIAVAMGINQALVKSVLFRARQRLNRALSDQARHQGTSGHSSRRRNDASTDQPPQVSS